jgi:hypothetical protein
MTPCMVRPCVARGFRRAGGCAVLRQCIRPLIGACCAPGHHGYQRACVLISGQASTGPLGSPVFACAGKTDPPSRLILSQTSAGNRLRGYVIDRSLSCAVPLFVLRAVPSSRPAYLRSRRAQARSRPAVTADLTPRCAAARPRLDGAEHGARIKQVGRLHHWSSASRTGAPWPAPPRRCGRACWRAQSPAHCGATVSWRLRSKA